MCARVVIAKNAHVWNQAVPCTWFGLLKLGLSVSGHLGNVEHVGLVDGTDLAFALQCDVKGDLGDAADLALFVTHVVEPETLTVLLLDTLPGTW